MEANEDSPDLQATIQIGNVNGCNSPTINEKMSGYQAIMSHEEMKIRGELEVEIERDLEQEIKDGIYHLALRLHRLYQHRKERENARESGPMSRQEKRNKVLSELTITIREEGGTIIEIKETKKQLPEVGRQRTSARSDILQGPVIVRNTRKKKFDWANSLRSSGESCSPMEEKDNKAVQFGWKW